MEPSTPMEDEVLRERHAERWALKACRSATFVRCLEAFGIASTASVSTPRNTTLAIHASGVYAARTRLLAHPDPEPDACRMSSTGDKLVELFGDRLLGERAGRYQYLASDDQRRWLKHVIILAVARHMMFEKYALYVRGLPAFADAWSCGELCRLQLLHALPGDLARLVHHIVADPEQQQALIERFHADLDARLGACLFAEPEPLPPLPEGARLPFAPLSQGKVEPDEQPRAAGTGD